MKAKIIRHLPDVDGVLIGWTDGGELGQLTITYDGKGRYVVDAEYIGIERILKIIQSIDLDK